VFGEIVTFLHRRARLILQTTPVILAVLIGLEISRLFR
jgi:hypothetical protein